MGRLQIGVACAVLMMLAIDIAQTHAVASVCDFGHSKHLAQDPRKLLRPVYAVVEWRGVRSIESPLYWLPEGEFHSSDDVYYFINGKCVGHGRPGCTAVVTYIESLPPRSVVYVKPRVCSLMANNLRTLAMWHPYYLYDDLCERVQKCAKRLRITIDEEVVMGQQSFASQ